MHRFFASPAPFFRPDLVHRPRIQWVCGLLYTKSFPRRRLFPVRTWCTAHAFNGFAGFFAPSLFLAGAFFPSGLGASPTHSMGLRASLHQIPSPPVHFFRPDLVHRLRIQWVCGLLCTKSLLRRRPFPVRTWCIAHEFSGFSSFFAPSLCLAGAFFSAGLGAPPTHSMGLRASLHQIPSPPAPFSRPDLVHRPRIQWVCGLLCTKSLLRRRFFPVRPWCTAHEFSGFAGSGAPNSFPAGAFFPSGLGAPPTHSIGLRASLHQVTSPPAEKGAGTRAEKRILTALRGEYTLSILLFLKKQPYKYRSSGWSSTFSGTSDVFSATASAFFGAGVSPTFRFLCRRTRNPIMSAKSTRITPMAMVARLEI